MASVIRRAVVRVHPLPPILRMSSSVFRAPCSFGYTEVGGSNPSSSTILTLGSHSTRDGGRRKRASIHPMNRIIDRAGLGIHDLAGGSIPPLGTYCGDSIGHVCERKRSPLQDNATINGKQAKAVRLAVSNLWEVFGRAWFEPTPPHHFTAM